MNGMRGFEKKRLMDCAPYEAVSPQRVLESDGVLTEEQLAERPEEGGEVDYEEVDGEAD